MTASQTKLKGLLRELFQLDNADLDFGIYRIMNAKRDEIERFLDNDLLPQVKKEFEQYQSSDSAGIRAELDKTIQQAKDMGVSDPEALPKVKELRTKLAGAVDVSALESQVFSDLYNFFRRYYSEGDFLSLRRYKEGVYAIPYEGEEVKLYWSNHDQYYVKSSEYLRDYSFVVSGSRRVHFVVVSADSDKDNNKAEAGNDRRFILATEDPVIEIRGELIVRFEYRSDENKRKQDILNAEAATTVLANPIASSWTTALFAISPGGTEHSVFVKHLADYTARNSFDYFIHKDVGGFLRRELDFYIKNEVMHLDDIDSASFAKVEQYLSRVTVLRRIARKIIDFVAQLEDFQKRLWLKKKFVAQTFYLVTVDLVPEDMHQQILANQAQHQEWVKLFAIDSTELNLQRKVAYSEPLSTAFLKEHPSLTVNTALFPQNFTEELLRQVGNLNDAVNGVVIQADNFHALSLIQERYKNQIGLCYIDPPYNTGGDGFIYKDSYQHASWLSMIEPRLLRGISCLSTDGILACSLDDNEAYKLNVSFETRRLPMKRIGEFVWRTRNTDNRVKSNLSVDHEYVFIYGFGEANIQGRVIDRSDFTNPDNDPRGVYTTDPLTGKANAIDRPNLHYTITNLETGDAYPPDPDFGWITDKAGFDAILKDKRVYWPSNPKSGKPRKKRFLTEAGERAPISSLGIAIKQGEGNQDLSDIMGKKVLNFPKPVSVMRTLVDACSKSTDLIMDFFAGSGTTGQAVIELNRKEGSSRKYVLVEMGQHFDDILVPRIRRCVYSKDWSEGKPVSREGTSQFIRCLRLESFEDSLANLVSHRSDAQQDLLSGSDSLREDFVLRYMLEVDNSGSPSLLNTEAFLDPFKYTLRIATGTVGETKPTTIDLVETFNWLLGLRVKTIDAIKGIRVVTGTSPQGEKVLVLWRNVKEMPNPKLDEFFQKQGYSTKDMEFDVIYVNGDNNLENLKKDEDTWKVRLIEEDFRRLMFDVQDV